MPCPYFEPQSIASRPLSPNFRLPLIEEYNGRCHALSDSSQTPGPDCLQLCNHGNPKGQCEHFPPGEKRSCFRYSVVQRSATSLEVICVEEQDYAPLRWHSLQYNFAAGRLETEPADLCMQAQALAFCRSYLQRFPG
jgi:hypothetical protein